MVRTAIAKRESTAELKFLRQRVAELEALVAGYQQDDKKSPQLEDEQKYKAVFESATDIIALMDKKGKITDVNNKFKEILGYEKEELLGKNLKSLNIESPNDIVNRKGRDTMVGNFQKRVVGAPISPYEIEVVKKDGELITLEVNACALNKDGRIIGDLAILKDVTERKRAEQTLKESEERLRIMLEAASEGFDLHDGKKIVDMNESGARMFGCTRSEIIGENINDFIAEESLDLISKNIRARYDQPYEAMFKRKNGSKFPVEIKAKSVTYQGRDVRLVSFRDLTAQRRYEEVLENIVGNAPVSMSIIQDGRFKFVNRQLCQDMGHTEAEVLALDVMQNVYPEDRELVRQNTLQMFSGRRTEPFEFRTVDNNGDVRWVLQSVTPINYNGRRATLGMYLDITERKLAEIEYKTIIQTTIDGFWHADMQGRFLDVNDAYCRLVGYSRDELLKMRIPDIEAVERPEETAARIARIKKNGSDRFETYHRCKDGRTVNVEISVNYVKVGEGSMVVFIRDITEHKRAEEALRKSELELKEAQSLGRIGNWEFDFTTREIAWSDEVYRLYERDRALGPPSVEEEAQYYLPEQTRKLREYSLLAVEKGKEYNYDLVANLPSGKTILLNSSVRPVKDEQGRVTKLFGTVQDITERKLAEKELKESEENFRSSFDNSPMGSMVFKLEGEIIYANRALLDIYGFSNIEELRNTPVKDRYTPETYAEYLVRNKEFLNGKTGPMDYEISIVRKDGTVRQLHAYRAEIIWGGEKQYQLRYIDITEKKQAEAVMRASEEKYRRLFERSAFGVVHSDSQGKILECNESFARIMGYTSPEEVIAQPIQNLIFNIEDRRQYIDRLRKSGFVSNEEFVARRKDGQPISILISASIMESLEDKREIIEGTLIDITERKKAEEALKISEERFRRLAENARDIIFRFRSAPSLGFDYISPAVLRISGYAPEEFYADPLLLFKIAHPDSRSFLKEITSRPQDYLDTPAILQWVRRDGEIFWTEQRTVPIYDKDGKVIATEGIIRDITDRKKSEEALKASEENFRNSLDSSSLGIRIVNENGDTLYANRAMLAVYGYESIDELNATGISERYTPESYAEHVLRQEKRRRGEPVPNEYEISIVHKDGTIRHLQVFRKEVLWDGKKQYQVLYNDMTEQKRMQEALKNSEEQFRRLAENARDFIYRYRIGDNPGYEYVSRAATRISGYTPEEYYADPQLLTHLIYPEDREKLQSIMNNLQEYRDKSFIVRYLRKDGKINWIEQRATYVLDDSGKVVAVQGIARDVTEREETARALKESGENYRNSIDSSPMGVVVFDKDEKILYANRAILDIYGFDNIEELRSTPVKERYTPESYAAYLLRSEKFRSGDVTSLGYELSVRRKDGGIRHLQAFRKEIVWDGEKQNQLLYTDITERKKAEDAMRESRARFRDLARMLPLSIWETDENGMINYTNEATMKLYGYTRQDTEPIHHLKNMAPQDRDRAARNTQRLLQGETLGGIEYTGLKKDGSTFPTMVYGSAIIRNGKGVGLRGITVDITEQKMAEKKLEQAAQEWRTTFDSLTDMVCILDNNFRITRVNMAYANMLKKEPQELLGKMCYELLNRDCSHPDCPHRKTLLTGKPARSEFLEPNLGTYVEVSTSPMFNEVGEVKGSVHIIRDISERKQMEQQLMLTDRLASVGELASGIAHELNNPLTSVIGFSQLLIEGGVPDNIKEDLNLINSEAQRAAGVVKNLLTFARKHAAVKQATKINNVIEDVLKLRAYEEKVNNIQIVKKVASDLPEIMIDYFQIQQVFLNLIINAEFFMTEAHHRGTLTITTEKVDKNIRISFADDGPGIPQENLKRIFDPFFTTKEVGKGTGLGLSICHGIIAEHGGNISAESEVGKGATFIVELPI